MPTKATTHVDAKGRICTKCNTYKEWFLFNIRTGTPTGYSSQCRECTRNYNRKFYNREYLLMRTYKLTTDEFELMFANQNGKCKLCLKEVVRTRLEGDNVAVVDHCHTFDNVRGILCTACNSLLGRVAEDKEFFKRCIDYLTP